MRSIVETWSDLRPEPKNFPAAIDALDIASPHSCRVIGWALDRNLDDELTLTALRMALANRVPLPGLVHHSDRGSQYDGRDYIERLKANQIQHVAAWQSLGQRGLRVLHENAEVRRGVPQ